MARPYRRIPQWLIPLALLVLVVCEQPAQAYVDPGSASYLFQLIVGGALGFLYLIRMYWTQLVEFIRTRRR